MYLKYLCPLDLKNDVMWDDFKFKFEIYRHEKKKVGFGIDWTFPEMTLSEEDRSLHKIQQ